MKHGKFFGNILILLELILLAGSVLLSLYLICHYLEYGEQAVSKTAIETETMVFSLQESETEDAASGAVSVADSPLLQYSADEAVTLRVQILNNEYRDGLFEKITIVGENGLTVERGIYEEDYSFVGVLQESVSGENDMEADMELPPYIETVPAGEVCTVTPADLSEGEVLRLSPGTDGTLTVTSLERSDGSPEYAGELFIYCVDGALALVNVLDLEEYLYAVVSSEMPSYFPAEALKAQAVCARTYAVQCMEQNVNEKAIADLDDSVKCQVYNNFRSTEASREAVEATGGELLLTDSVQYYSTSCLSEHRGDLGEEQAFREFLMDTPDEGAEYGSAWVRWKAELPVSVILEKLETEYEIHADGLSEISVESRGGNGQVLLLRVTAETETAAEDTVAEDSIAEETIACSDGVETVEVEGEYAIRQFLSPGETDVELLDGTIISGMQLLPSAFFLF